MRLVFFFFKQKTAYEMRISDWSSDVCSSDLTHRCAFDRVVIQKQHAVKTEPKPLAHIPQIGRLGGPVNPDGSPMRPVQTCHRVVPKHLPDIGLLVLAQQA